MGPEEGRSGPTCSALCKLICAQAGQARLFFSLWWPCPFGWVHITTDGVLGRGGPPRGVSGWPVQLSRGVSAYIENILEQFAGWLVQLSRRWCVCPHLSDVVLYPTNEWLARGIGISMLSGVQLP